MGSENKNNRSFLSLPVLRDILVVLVLCVLAWKFIDSKIVLNLEQFGFSDLVSILLAFFAIGLSAAFFFKATETSNRFYDNVYKFTKEVSEMLGRIEAGFGERLKHLDEGYSGLRDKFDQIPFDINQAKSEAKKEEKEVEKKERERMQVMEELARRAQLQQDEKEKMFAEMKSRERALMRAREQLLSLQRQIDDAESSVAVSRDLADYLRPRLGELASLRDREEPSSVIVEKFRKVSDRLHAGVLLEMKRAGLLDDDGDLNRRGVDFIRDTIGRSSTGRRSG